MFVVFSKFSLTWSFTLMEYPAPGFPGVLTAPENHARIPTSQQGKGHAQGYCLTQPTFPGNHCPAQTDQHQTMTDGICPKGGSYDPSSGLGCSTAVHPSNTNLYGPTHRSQRQLRTSHQEIAMHQQEPNPVCVYCLCSSLG